MICCSGRPHAGEQSVFELDGKEITYFPDKAFLDGYASLLHPIGGSCSRPGPEPRRRNPKIGENKFRAEGMPGGFGYCGCHVL
jgi:hypothetical protein